MTADFLLELLSEEIPARMQEKASADLARLFATELAKWNLKAERVESFVTPRRLALIARGLPTETEPVSEELKGPRADAPEQAIVGFLGKTGLTRADLIEREDAKGKSVLFAIREIPAIATSDVLANVIFAIVNDFPWPKSMRWGAGSRTTTSLRWVRPLQGIVALFGETVVPIAIDGIEAGAATLGHRFHHPGQITFRSAADYAEKLRMCHVLVDPAERKAIIRARCNALAAEAGLVVVPDEGLVAENAGLTEWPVPLLGHFDAAFLEVPREVIQLTLGTNQRYFVLNDAAEKLAPAFLCTANIEAADGGEAIVAGNRKVLSARLSDARFFWEQDLKVSLAKHAEKLRDIVFHEKLGTVADKVERVAKLARWLVEEGIVAPDATRSPARAGARGLAGEAGRESAGLDPGLRRGTERKRLADLAEQAAKLCKADLVTGMVGEFPELQGVMGGYYARAEGLPDEVADAIRDHYKPVGQGDAAPTAPVTVAVSLADKLDTIACFFMKDLKPTGSKDPFALRRAALGVMSLVFINGLRGSLASWLANARQLAKAQGVSDERAEPEPAPTLRAELRQQSARVFMHDIRDFLADRLKVQQREAGVRHDLIDAVFAVGGEDDLVRLLARVKALQAFVGTGEGADLLAGYRRAANILRKENYTVAPAEAGAHVAFDQEAPPGEKGRDSRLRGNDGEGRGGAPEKHLSYTPEKAETELLAALDAAGPLAAGAVAREEFAGAMAALATLRAPIDAFFEAVTVNDADPAKRAARLALLARIRDAVHQVADFSKIEG